MLLIMRPKYDFASLSAAIRSREELLLHDWTPRHITRALEQGDLVRLATARYLDGPLWRELWPDEKLLARVIAVSRTPHFSGYFFRESAAVLHGLRLYMPAYDRAHLLAPSPAVGKRSRYVTRSAVHVSAGDIGLLNGIPSTSLARTAQDLARLAPPELALGALDHALQLQFGEHRGIPNSPEAVEWLDLLRQNLLAIPGRRGIRRALRLIDIADAGAESVLESLGRLRFVQSGYRVSTQSPVRRSNGRMSYFDLELDGLDILCEIDGGSKYLDAETRRGKSADEVFLAEKRREDEARGSTTKRVIRLMHEDLSTPDRFSLALRNLRVPPP